MNQANIGLVIGKFMPLQLGHEFLLQFAKQHCKRLVVIVDCLEGQTLSPEVRKEDIENAVPGITVVALTKNMPQDPSDTPDFWDIWRETLLSAVFQATGGRPDVILASESYGIELAHELSCSFIPCDVAREGVPISASMIRKDPMANWRYISSSSRKHFLKKVCFIGPESTGKSMCAMDVARYFDTVYVPEYAKALIVLQDGEFYPHNVDTVATGQVFSERALARLTNRVMVCDTDVLTTLIWSEFLFGSHPESMDQLVRDAHYDITFLFEPDVLWVADVHRKNVQDAANPDVRAGFLDLCKHWLNHFNRPYISVKGSYEDRFKTCVRHCQQLIASPED